MAKINPGGSKPKYDFDYAQLGGPNTTEAQRKNNVRRTKQIIEYNRITRAQQGKKASKFDKAYEYMYDIPVEHKRYPGESYAGSRLARDISKTAYRVTPGFAQVAAGTEAVRGIKKAAEMAKSKKIREKEIAEAKKNVKKTAETAKKVIRKATPVLTPTQIKQIKESAKGVLPKFLKKK
jgi:hypothetical protein